MAATDPTDRPRPDLPTRFRCATCGNLTRFDVFETRRTRAYHHFTLGGDLSIDEEEVLEARRERVVCRWCGSADAIEEVPVEVDVSAEPARPPPEEPRPEP
jgi:transcription elongation factor Elf1